MDLPCSVIEPIVMSCRLCAGGHIASNQVPAILISASGLKCDFALQLTLFDTFMAVHFRSSHDNLPDGFSSTFSPSVHHNRLTAHAERSGLTTPPEQRCRYFAAVSYLLLYHLEYSMLEINHSSLTSRHNERSRSVVAPSRQGGISPPSLSQNRT